MAVNPNEFPLDLGRLMDAGIVRFRDEGGLRGFDFTDFGERLLERAESESAYEKSATAVLEAERGVDRPDPCSHCGSTKGYDSGARCLVCHVAASPDW